MNVVLIGGIGRLEPQYLKEAQKCGVNLRVFNTTENRIETKLKHADAVVIFTNMVSHKARKQAMAAARTNDIPVFMHHECGLCTLRECLKCIHIINHQGGSEDA